MNRYDPQPPEVLDRDVDDVSRYPPLGPVRRNNEPGYQLFEWFAFLFEGGGGTYRLYKHDKCWGATIVRVSYEDDELFARAVRDIRRLTLLGIEMQRDVWAACQKTPLQVVPSEVEPLEFVSNYGIPPCLAPDLAREYHAVVRVHADANPGRGLTVRDVIAGELLRRHHNFVLEDRETLDGVDPAAAWLYHKERSRELEDHHRSSFFIYLDRESIERLARAPGEEELATMTRDEKAALLWGAWVSIIATEGHINHDDVLNGIEPPAQTAISPLAQRLRLLRLGMWFDLAEILSHVYLDEAGCEGDDHERCPEYDIEWTVCYPEELFDFPGKSKRMEELYGPEK